VARYHGVHRGCSLRFLSPDGARRIHQATLEVLENTGVQVYGGEALGLLRQAGAGVEDTRVRIPAGLVERALAAAPSRIYVWDRDGRPRLDLGGSNVYFGPGPTCPNILDVRTGLRRPVRRQDVEEYARLADALSGIDFVMSMGILSDCPAELSDVEEFAAMLLHTAKPIVAWSWDVGGAADILAMALAFREDIDDLRNRPLYLFYCEPSSPLRHTEAAVRKLLYCAGAGLPVIYGSGPVGGASSPVTVEGMMVTGNAEVLSGLVMAQLKRPGAPFVYGAGTGPLDMATMVVAYGAPEFMLGQAALSDMAGYYGLPSWGFGGCSESKLPDEQAACASALWNLVAGLSGANLIHDLGFLESGLTGSMELLVMNDEIVALVRRIMRGFREDGGRWSRTASLMDREAYPGWAGMERTTMGERARQKALAILGERRRPPPAPGERVKSVLERAWERTGRTRTFD